MSTILTFLGRGQGGDEGDTRDEKNPRQIAEEKAKQNVKREDYLKQKSLLLEIEEVTSIFSLIPNCLCFIFENC